MYKDMSINRVVSSTSVSSATLFLGLTKVLTGGLILGYVFGQFFTILLLKNKIIKNDFRLQLKRKFVIMKSYIHYPKYLIPATLASEVSNNVPIIMVTNYFTSSITGFFSFANKVTALPISFIGNAIGEVYRQKASEEYALHGNCKELYLKTLFKLSLLGLLSFIFLFSTSEFLFGFVFGQEWVEAGKIAKYLSFLIFFQLISTPLAYTITFNKSQKYDMILQFLRAMGSIFAIFAGYKLNNYLLSVLFYSIVYSLYYIFHSLIQYRAAVGIKN